MRRGEEDAVMAFERFEANICSLRVTFGVGKDHCCRLLAQSKDIEFFSRHNLSVYGEISLIVALNSVEAASRVVPSSVEPDPSTLCEHNPADIP